MKPVLTAAVALLSAGTAQAGGFYHCDRFNAANTYEVRINASTAEATFTGNKAAQLQAVAVTEGNPGEGLVSFQAEGESALVLDLDVKRLEATVSTVDAYGNREEIGYGVCRIVKAI